LARADTEVRSLRAWLTTVVGRICLDMLRSRAARREDPIEDGHLPDPIVTAVDDDPQARAELADSVGLALLIVLETLSPAERLAFVLHDVFGVPFDQIGPMLDRSPAAAKQLASRARQRLRSAGSTPDADARRHSEVLDAFLSASREGDFEGLVALLHPDVVLRADAGDGPLGPSRVLRGPVTVAGQAQRYAGLARSTVPVLVNGAPGLVAAPRGVPMAIVSIAVRDGLISEIDILADPERLRRVLPPGLTRHLAPDAGHGADPLSTP
jgi:RNA polymerase sigma-70 factor (ECF subfamily)